MATQTEHDAMMVRMAAVVAEAIQRLGTIPSGHLYARMMTHMSYTEYSQIIDILKVSSLVSETGHMLKWTGKV